MSICPQDGHAGDVSFNLMMMELQDIICPIPAHKPEKLSSIPKTAKILTEL
jgi:hypothetical protein